MMSSDEVSGKLLIADDIVLISKTKQLLNTKLKRWRRILETNGLRISRTKTEYMAYNFSGIEEECDYLVKIGNDAILHGDKFRYPSTMVESRVGLT